jgi:hypothetical protein
LGVWSNLILINSEKSHTECNGPHYTELETLNLNPDFEFQQLLVSLKHVINLIMWIRDTGERVIKAQRTIVCFLPTVAQSPDGENRENPLFPKLLLR